MKHLIMLLIFCCAQANAQGDPRQRDIVNKIAKSKAFSGCYVVGTSVADYRQCMDGRSWDKAEGDADLLSYCKALHPADPEKNVCIKVSAAAKESHEAKIRDAGYAAFLQAFDAEKENTLCFKPEDSIEQFDACIKQATEEGQFVKELDFIDRLQSSTTKIQLSKGRNLSYAYKEKYFIPQKITAVKTALTEFRENRREIRDRERAIEQAESQRMAVQAQQEQRDYEAQLEKKCGTDYLTVRIGMSEKRLAQCAEAYVVGENGNNIRVYKTGTGLTVRVVNGKVTAWVGR